MKTFLNTRIIVAAVAAISVSQLARANTELWIGNPGASVSTNWSDNANWNNVSGGGSPGPNGNDVIFGDGGAVGTAGTVSSVVDSSPLNPNSMLFTNQSQLSAFHTVLIPAGVLTNASGLTVGLNSAVNGYLATVSFAGGGTVLQNGANTVVKQVNSASSSGARATLDLSSLSNFVISAGSALVVAGGGADARGGGTLTLADGSNYISVASITNACGNGNGGAGGILNLGAGTNVINVGTLVAANGKINNATIKFLGSAGGLRLRGTGGTDSDRVTMLFAHRNAGGTGNLVATLDFSGHPVNIKAGTITMGQGTTQPTGTSALQPGLPTFNFNSGIVDATTINMAINSQSLATNFAVLTVGTGGTLVVSNISLVNQTAGGGTGHLYVGGSVNSIGGINKTTLAGTGNVTVTNGLVTIGAGSTMGTVGTPIDNLTLENATLTLAGSSGTPAVVANNLNINGTGDTINVTSVPGLGQFQLIVYTTLNGAYDFNLGTLAGGYQGYLSNNVAGLSVDIVITNVLIKTDTWRGNVNGNWDTSTLNWASGGATNYAQGDFVVFDDTLTGTPNVNLTTSLTPGSLTVNNSSANYVFSGTGKLTGVLGLTKSGSGTLRLSETGGDDFSGGIAVSGGTLILDNAGSATSGGLTISAGATAQLGNNTANGVLPSGGLTVDGTLRFSRTSDLTVGTSISGNGEVVKNGSAKLTLSANNGYTGNTTVSAGTLALTGVGSIASSAQVAISGAGLDVSGANGPTTLATLNLTNASVTVAMPNTTTPVNVSGLNMGGGGNTINVTALPPIASYPAAITVIQSASPVSGFNATLGTLPAATPSYAGNVSLSGDQLSVRVTLTAGPIGVRPVVFWSGADLPNLNTNWSDALNWLLQGAPTAVDNAVFNNTATAAASALTTPGGGTAALDPANYNNIVNTDFTISTLSYTNTGGTYHNTHLNNGRTLNLTNTLTIGAIDAGGTVTQEGVSISGSAATVSVNNPNANLQVWLGNQNAGNQATLDMSALDNFSGSVSRLTVGASAVNNAVNRPSGILYLAKTNTISTGFQTTTIEAGTTTGNAGIVVGDCNANAGPASFLHLGRVNTIAADTIAIARQKTTATMRFNTIYANVAPYPSAVIQGFSSPRVSVFDVGSGVGNTGTTTGTGTADFTGGTVTIMADTMSVGRASTPASGTSGGTTTGILSFDAGTINVNTLNVGLQPVAANTLRVGNGTVNVGTNATIGAPANLVVNGDLSLAVNNGGSGTVGTLSINGGNVTASNIVAGTGSGNSTVGLTDGTLTVTHTAGTPAAPITALNLTGGTLQLNVDGSIGAASLVATAITPSGTTALKIGSVANVTTATTYPLISYTGTDPFSSLSLVSLPPGASGTLVDDTANSLIGITFTTVPIVPPTIGSITTSGNNLVFSGSGGPANANYVVVATTNVALPRTSWTRIVTNSFDGSGNFSYSTPIDPTKPVRFFAILIP